MTSNTKTTVKHAGALVACGLALGIVGSTALFHAGEASADDAAPALVDAAPAPVAPPDAAIVHAGSASTLPPIPMPSDDAPGFGLSAYKWLASGNGWYALVPLLILLSWLAMHPKMWPLSKFKAYQAFIESKRGKVAVVGFIALTGLLATALAATGAPPGLGALKPLALQVLAAMGGYEGIRILIWG